MLAGAGGQGQSPRGHLGGEKTPPSHKDTRKSRWGNRYPFCTNTSPSLTRALPGGHEVPFIYPPQRREEQATQQQTPQQDTGIRESNSETGPERVCPSYQPHRHKTTSFLLPIPCWLLATTTSSEEGRDFLVLPFSNFSAWFRLSGCPAHRPWRAQAMLRAKLCRGQATTLGNRCAKVSSLVPIPQGRQRRIFNPKHFNSLRIINRVCRNNRNINWVGLKSKKCLNKS